MELYIKHSLAQIPFLVFLHDDSPTYEIFHCLVPCPQVGDRAGDARHLSLFLATAAAAAHDVSPSSAHSFSTVLCHVSLGRPRGRPREIFH